MVNNERARMEVDLLNIPSIIDIAFMHFARLSSHLDIQQN